MRRIKQNSLSSGDLACREPERWLVCHNSAQRPNGCSVTELPRPLTELGRADKFFSPPDRVKDRNNRRGVSTDGGCSSAG